MFIIFSGLSGSGKQTIINRILQNHKNSKFVKSATTRPVRKGEEDLHFHMSEKEFIDRQDNGEFFETALVHGYNYGILKKSLEEVIENPDMLFVKDVDVWGTENLLKNLKGVDFLTFFLEVPDDLLYERLIKRGESHERATTRLERGKIERKYKKKYDYCVENIDLEKAVQFVEDKINEKLRKNKK